MQNSSQDVLSAFDILMEAIEAEIEFFNGLGSKAFEARDYEQARRVLEQVGKITAFREQTATLRAQWESLTAMVESAEDEDTKQVRRNLGRDRRGERTPESAYVKPILEVLVEMGGSGRVSEILDRLLVKMKPVLKEVDFQPLTSEPENPRWRNSARWARNTMVKDGLLKKTSPHGVWEVSEEGRAYLSR